MYVKIRKISDLSTENDLIVTISKMALIQELELKIELKWNIPQARQKLFYKGKQLAHNYRIMDYEIQLNDVIQLMIRTETESNTNICVEIANEDEMNGDVESENEIEAESKYYMIGDEVDIRDSHCGAWFEAVIDNIKRKVTSAADNEYAFLFHVKHIQGDTAVVTFEDIRPRARHVYNLSELAVGHIVMVNYNVEDSGVRGYWYDMQIDKIKKTNKQKIIGTINVGIGKVPIKDCDVIFLNEIMRIEKPVLLIERPKHIGTIPKRLCQYYCLICRDIPDIPCKECGCQICEGKENPLTIILCDECNNGYHISCLNPPLLSVPANVDWYCPSCKNNTDEIVKAGDKLIVNPKKAKMPSSNESYKGRDWGHGMACVGRTKECTIVPKNYFGPIPGIEVGTRWKFRVQVSEAGVHRPHVAGIHGRENEGAYSLILSGGYEDDVDNGEEFLYTGSGGRDLSGNKRMAEQSCDQELKRMNKALALSCNAKFNDEEGATSKDWKSGKPVRVIRNYKLGKHSRYAPKEGNRYDGIYKVVKYYPVKGKSGFIVWRYLLKRDDPIPAPWTPNGQELDIIYPPGYLEAKANEHDSSRTINKKKRGVKRVLSEQNLNQNKKLRLEKFGLNDFQRKLIHADKKNKKLWDECAQFLNDGKRVYLTKIQELFICICCQEVVYKPITTSCKHNMCLECLQRSFSAEIYTCPYCRKNLGKNYKMTINKALSEILLELLPGYEKSR